MTGGVDQLPAPTEVESSPSARIPSHPGVTLARRQRLLYILVLGALVALGPFTIDLYLPAFPSVARELRATDPAVQLTLTATAVGFALGQLLIGPWSDRVGRRTPLLIAIGLHVCASIGVALAPNIAILIVLRITQGIGAAGGAVVALAVVRDLFGGRPLLRMLARLSLVSGVAPIIAPIIGSQLLKVMEWRGVFVVLAVYGGLMMAAAALVIIETLPAESRRRESRGASTAGYRALLGDRVFIGVAIIGGMVFATVFCYLSSSSLLLQDVFRLSAQQYGLVFAINSVGVVLGAQISSRVARRIEPQWILVFALPLILAGAAALVITSVVGGGIVGVLLPLFVIMTSCGFCFPIVQVLALAHHGREAGTAASVLGVMNYGLAGVISPVVGVLGISSARSTGAVMIGTVTIALLSLWILVRPRSVRSIED